MYLLTVVGGQKPAEVVSKTMLPAEAAGQNPFLASSGSLWWLLTFLGLWPQHSNLCLQDHILFCLIFLSLPLL